MHRVCLLQPVMQTLMGLRVLLYTHVGNIHLIDMKDRESYKNREFTKSLYGQDFDSKDEGVTLLEFGDGSNNGFAFSRHLGFNTYAGISGVGLGFPYSLGSPLQTE